jgi:hypothetical protein
MKRILFPLMLAVTLFVNVNGLGVPRAYAQTHASESDDTAPFNLVIIVLDASRSFRIPSKAPGIKGKILADEALHIVQQLFRDTANQKRRRTDGHDVYYLVAADAASQTIWSGTREQLAEITPQELARKLAIREQFANCTDLEAALNAVATIIRQHPQAAEVYVLTFSDLLHEPPHNSYQKCQPPTGEPPRGIEWKAFTHAQLGFYFVSQEFRYRPDLKWKAELQRQGLRAEFLDAAQALSAGVTLHPPAPAEYKPTDAQVQDARRRMKELEDKASGAFTYFGILSIAAIVGLFVWVGRKRQHNGTRRPR